jgi:hypothetical protein
MVTGVEALSEPAVDFGQHRTRLAAFALPFEQPELWVVLKALGSARAAGYKWRRR